MAGGQDIPALGIKTPQIAGGKRGDKEKEAEETTPRPTPKMHTIKKGEMLQTIGYQYGTDTDLAYGDAGGTILSRINAKVLRQKDGSQMPPNVFLDDYVGVNIWLEEPLDYTKRLNEWYKNNPSEKPIRLPLIQKSASKGGKNKKAEDTNADFLAYKKMYNLPNEMTYEEAWVYWREELMWRWADDNPDLVVYDLDNTEMFDFDATYWEWYKTTPMYAQEQAKIGQHLLNFGYFMSEILGASGIPNMKAPPVRPKHNFLGKSKQPTRLEMKKTLKEKSGKWLLNDPKFANLKIRVDALDDASKTRFYEDFAVATDDVKKVLKAFDADDDLFKAWKDIEHFRELSKNLDFLKSLKELNPAKNHILKGDISKTFNKDGDPVFKATGRHSAHGLYDNANNGLNGFLCLFTPQVKTCG